MCNESNPLWFAIVVGSTLLGEVEEHHTRRVADGGVVAGEREAAGLAVDAEDGHVVAALVAAVEEAAGRIKGETAWVVAARPFLADILHLTASADGQDANAVVQSIADVEELAVGRDQDLRAEVAADEAGVQGR